MAEKKSGLKKLFSKPEKDCRSEEHTSELQSRFDLVCRLLLEKKKITRESVNFKSTEAIGETEEGERIQETAARAGEIISYAEGKRDLTGRGSATEMTRSGKQE